MTDLERAIRALSEYDERKRQEAEALVSGMPTVDRYVAQNADEWMQRRELGAA